MAELQTPARYVLRRILRAVLANDSDFTAFCVDFYPDVAARFANGMDRVQKASLRRKGAGDREQAVTLLKKAQAEAIQMNLPEAQQIELLLNRLTEKPSAPSTNPPIPAP